MGDQFKSMYLEEAKTAEHGGIEGNLMCAPQGTKNCLPLFILLDTVNHSSYLSVFNIILLKARALYRQLLL